MVSSREYETSVAATALSSKGSARRKNVSVFPLMTLSIIEGDEQPVATLGYCLPYRVA